MSAPDRSNSVSASVPVPATDTSKPSLRSMYDRASENDSSSSTTSTRDNGRSFLHGRLRLDLNRYG